MTKTLDQFVTQPNAWIKLGSWDVTDALTGSYNYDSQLINKEYVVAPNTGIYYATAIAPIDGIDSATELALALVNGDDSNENSFGLISKQQSVATETTLSIAGFVKIYAGQQITVQVKGTAPSYKVLSSSSFSLHYIGPTGAVPAYLAQLDGDQQLPRAGTGTDTDLINSFITEGRAKLYTSLSGE